MGYISDVQSVIYGPTGKIDALIMAASMQNLLEPLKNCVDLEKGIFDLNKAIIRLYADGVKWYESFPEVQAWDKILDLANEKFELTYEFMRIGEEDTDIEYRSAGDPEYFLRLNRSITDESPITENEAVI